MYVTSSCRFVKKPAKKEDMKLMDKCSVMDILDVFIYVCRVSHTTLNNGLIIWLNMSYDFSGC